jgi:uncharacterized protein YqiB (DUF1249 family)
VEVEAIKKRNEVAFKELQAHYEEQFTKLRACIFPSIDALTSQESLTRLISDHS